MAISANYRAFEREHLAAVEAKIADLSRLADELKHLGGQCKGGTIARCRIVEALLPE